MNFLSKLYSDCSLLLPSSLVKCLDRGFHDINSLFFSVHKDSTERRRFKTRQGRNHQFLYSYFVSASCSKFAVYDNNKQTRGEEKSGRQTEGKKMRWRKEKKEVSRIQWQPRKPNHDCILSSTLSFHPLPQSLAL